MAQMSSLPKVLYSISQVNALTGVPKSTIRFWEKEFAEFLSPLRTDGNQRRYNTDAVRTVEQINELVNLEGYTLEGARRKMRGSEVQGSPESSDQENPAAQKQMDELAETMSDYILKRLFERVKNHESNRGDVF